MNLNLSRITSAIRGLTERRAGSNGQFEQQLEEGAEQPAHKNEQAMPGRAETTRARSVDGKGLKVDVLA